jgi:hypothetical protein
MKKYTYENWLDGSVILKYDYFIPAGKKPILVSWDNFCTDDISLIKIKQKEIFDTRVFQLLDTFKSEFNKQIESSLDSKEHCRRTINQIDFIFKKDIPPSEFITTVYWDCTFSYIDLKEIQLHFNNVMRGLEVDYNFINSPLRDYQSNNENPKIYAQALYLFRKWLLAPLLQETDSETALFLKNFKNNFDNNEPSEIFNHFKTGLVDKGYIIEQELYEYLKAAFELKTIPETLFKLIHKPANEKIYTLFYTYYNEISGKPHKLQTQYAELLGNYFQGFKTEVIKTNWTRGYIKKK